MKNFDDMTIGEAKALAAMFGSGSTAARLPVQHGMAIAILDRGFVYVGTVTTDGEWCHIDNAQNVRRWGTTKGLGQLALEGPQANTVLDPAGAVRAPMRSVVGLIQCEAAKWKR